MKPKSKKQSQNYSDLESRIKTIENDIAKKASIKTLNNCDLNELISEGSGLFIAYANPEITNAPENIHQYVIPIVHNSNYAVQYAISLYSTKVVYIRRKVAGAWEEWSTL